MDIVEEALNQGKRHAANALYEHLETEFTKAPEVFDGLLLDSINREQHGWRAEYRVISHPDYRVIVRRARDVFYTDVCQMVARFSKFEPASNN